MERVVDMLTARERIAKLSYDLKTMRLLATGEVAFIGMVLTLAVTLSQQRRGEIDALTQQKEQNDATISSLRGTEVQERQLRTESEIRAQQLATQLEREQQRVKVVEGELSRLRALRFGGKNADDNNADDNNADDNNADDKPASGDDGRARDAQSAADNSQTS